MRSFLVLLAAMVTAGCESEVPEDLDATLQLELIGQYGSREGPLALQSIRQWGWGPGDYDEPYVLQFQLSGGE